MNGWAHILALVVEIANYFQKSDFSAANAAENWLNLLKNESNKLLKFASKIQCVEQRNNGSEFVISRPKTEQTTNTFSRNYVVMHWNLSICSLPVKERLLLC